MARICFTVGAQTQIPLENFFKNLEKDRLSGFARRNLLLIHSSIREPPEPFCTENRIGHYHPHHIWNETWHRYKHVGCNNRILIIKDTRGDKNYQLYGVNIDGSDLKSYTYFPNVRTKIIYPLKKIDSLVIIGMNKRNPRVFDPTTWTWTQENWLY